MGLPGRPISREGKKTLLLWGGLGTRRPGDRPGRGAQPAAVITAWARQIGKVCLLRADGSGLGVHTDVVLRAKNRGRIRRLTLCNYLGVECRWCAVRGVG